MYKRLNYISFICSNIVYDLLCINEYKRRINEYKRRYTWVSLVETTNGGFTTYKFHCSVGSQNNERLKKEVFKEVKK